MTDTTNPLTLHTMTATPGMTIVVHHEWPPHPTEVHWSTLNPDGTRDLYTGDCPMLTGCTLDDIAHFLQHGYSECPDGADKCPLGQPIHLS